MKSLSTLSLALIATLAFSTSNTILHPTTAAALPSTSNDNNTVSIAVAASRAGFFESLQSPSSAGTTGSREAPPSTSAANPLTQKFIIPNEKGPSSWSCSYIAQEVLLTSTGTSISIGRRSKRKPFSCGELISRETNLDYGRYSVDMISSNVKGHVSGFFLIAPNGASEIDVELTGLNSTVGWMNVWKSGKQHPVKIPLGFDASKGWHTYTIEWRKGFIAWFVDNKQVYRRSDVATLEPRKNLYKLALNSWTSQSDDQWAGRFSLPGGKTVVKTQFRNLRYTP
ncbi:MAG: glycosyl hydrolases family 16-domain-containing protein [Linnemannia gamsii]|nr:MAG: glycosyl hydrolases family 16-domain-containing protein [Linnemannia gamsii]